MNTKTQEHKRDTSPNGNTTKGIRARVWFITWNNPTEECMTLWHKELKKTKKYIWQLEEGKENKTLHIQGHLEYANPVCFDTLRKRIPGAHIEKTRNIKQAEEYCQKYETSLGKVYKKGYEEELSLEERLINHEYKDIVWRQWQQNVLNIIEGEVNKREINWIYEPIGNIGKSFLCKYIGLKYNSIICSGKTNDIFNQVRNWRIENPNELQIPPVIVDIPRSEFSHTNYAAIESLKNGFLYSGKYEGGKIYGLSPHIIVMANSPPNTTQLSADRWNIMDLTPENYEPIEI